MKGSCNRAVAGVGSIGLALVWGLLTVNHTIAVEVDTNGCRSATTEALILDATRYGSTPEKKAAKSGARAELLARGTNALQVLMESIHVENIALPILTQEVIEHLSAEASAAVLLPYLKACRPRTRRFAAYFLGLRDTPQYSGQVMPLLRDEESAGVALQTLGKWKVRAAVPDIVPFLKHEKEVCRVAAVNALREIGDPAVAPGLIDTLDDPFFTVREAAQQALVGLGPQAEKAMIQALPGARDGKLRHLIRALGQSKSRAASRAIRAYAESSDPEVRADVVDAMARQQRR